MLNKLTACTLLACAAAFSSAPVAAQSSPEVTLTRLDCGTPVLNDVGRFNDAYAYNGLKVLFTFSCYLIKHGDEYLLWDTGHAMTAGAPAPKVSIVDQLAQLKLKPEQIKYVGISHYHADHTGQVASFPGSTILIGKGDWDGITAPKPNVGASINTPGHTPGHHSLLVRLKEMGNVLISGDLAHFHENYENNGVPGFNFHRGDTMASLDRFKKAAANLKATVIIQHDARDVNKLPAFPSAAK
jgi:N-acyl homoserine lactone hydrolase